MDNIKIETTEIQTNTFEEIASHSAKDAIEKSKRSVLKNDTALFIEVLNVGARNLFLFQKEQWKIIQIKNVAYSGIPKDIIF